MGAVRCGHVRGQRGVERAETHKLSCGELFQDATGAALLAPCLWGGPASGMHASGLSRPPSARVPGLPVGSTDVTQPLHRGESLACRGERPKEADGDFGEGAAGP